MRIGVILQFLQHMYAMHIEPQGRDLHASGCHDLCADVREVAKGGLRWQMAKPMPRPMPKTHFTEANC